jgi:hypothetical protein
VWDPSDEKEEGDTKKTAYIRDSMDEEDRVDTIEILKQTDESKRNVGDQRLMDGDEQETFGSRSQKRFSNAG